MKSLRWYFTRLYFTRLNSFIIIVRGHINLGEIHLKEIEKNSKKMMEKVGNGYWRSYIYFGLGIPWRKKRYDE